jgi:acyl carrier protein
MSVKREELIEKICECLFVDIQSVSPDTQLDDLEGWDSVGRLSIAVLLSDLFSIRVDTRQLKSCQTINDIIEIANGHLHS